MRALATFALAATMLTATAAAPASAQDWPTRSVKIIVAFSPGGSADQFGRLIAEALSETFGQQFYIEYHPGSSGTIGAALTARAVPDGYTLMIGGSGPHITSPAINPNVGYDPIKDFSHIAMIGADGFVLIANPTLGIDSLAVGERQAKACFAARQFRHRAGIERWHHLLLKCHAVVAEGIERNGQADVPIADALFGAITAQGHFVFRIVQRGSEAIGFQVHAFRHFRTPVHHRLAEDAEGNTRCAQMRRDG